MEYCIKIRMNGNTQDPQFRYASAGGLPEEYKQAKKEILRDLHVYFNLQERKQMDYIWIYKLEEESVYFLVGIEK